MFVFNLKVQVGHLCVYTEQTVPEYLFLFCFEVNLVEFLPISFEGMS